MQFNVAQQLKAPIGSSRSYRIEEAINLTDENSYLLSGEVNLLRSYHGILVQANLETSIELICSRCLSVFSHTLRLRIEEQYSSISEVADSMALPAENGSFLIDENHILDLNEAVRQHVLLARPMKPLCSDDCAGLCPDCGHNLNQGPCRCTPVEASGTGKESR